MNLSFSFLFFSFFPQTGFFGVTALAVQEFDVDQAVFKFTEISLSLLGLMAWTSTTRWTSSFWSLVSTSPLGLQACAIISVICFMRCREICIQISGGCTLGKLCILPVCGTGSGHERASDLLELSRFVGAGVWTWFFWKSSQCWAIPSLFSVLTWFHPFRFNKERERGWRKEGEQGWKKWK